MRSKFRFSARVEYVTEELDHSGTLFYMFNIKVRHPNDLPDTRETSSVFCYIKNKSLINLSAYSF
jgi:hypothetical protein